MNFGIFPTYSFHLLSLSSHSFIPKLIFTVILSSFSSHSARTPALFCHHIIPASVHFPSQIHSAGMSVCSCLQGNVCVDIKQQPRHHLVASVERQREREKRCIRKQENKEVREICSLKPRSPQLIPDTPANSMVSLSWKISLSCPLTHQHCWCAALLPAGSTCPLSTRMFQGIFTHYSPYLYFSEIIFIYLKYQYSLTRRINMIFLKFNLHFTPVKNIITLSLIETQSC